MDDGEPPSLQSDIKPWTFLIGYIFDDFALQIRGRKKLDFGG